MPRRRSSGWAHGSSWQEPRESLPRSAEGKRRARYRPAAGGNSGLSRDPTEQGTVSSLLLGVCHLRKVLSEGGAASGQFADRPSLFHCQGMEALPGIALHVKNKARPISHPSLTSVLDPMDGSNAVES